MRIAVFGPTILSSLLNPHGGYFCGILRALHARGHRIDYYAEHPDAPHDREPPTWGEIIHYASAPEAALRVVEAASGADLLIKTSRAGPCGAFITEALLDLQRPGCQVVFWDTDPPATFASIHRHPASPLHRLIPRFDQVFTNSGGAPAIAAYRGVGASRCTVIYPAIDPEIHHPVAPEERFRCDLALLSDQALCDESETREHFFQQVNRFPTHRFFIAGNGWDGLPPMPNLQIANELSPTEQNCLSASAGVVLAPGKGSAPAPRLFEAAGAGACLITNAWAGVGELFDPEGEIIIAPAPEETARFLDDPERARAIGRAALQRVLKEHTYTHRALQLEEAL